MNVLLIHQAFVSPEEAGGTRHYEFARRCAENGYVFTIVASNLSYLSGRRVSTARGIVSEESVDGIRILRAYTYPSLHRSFVWRVLSFLSFMVTSLIAGLRARHVDIVMGTSPPIFQAASAWLVAFLRRRPFVLEVRDLWPSFAIDMGILTNPVLILVARWLERFLYARATHIVVNSPAYKDYLLEEGVSATKVTLIPNGVDPGMFDPGVEGQAVREELRLDGLFVATYAGALGLANDIPVILKAAERLKHRQDIHFLLVGDGKERDNLEKMATSLCLSNVTFVGSRPKSQMKDFLAASDVCLATLQDIPMFRTTYPNKVFDYMAAGRPTILTIDGVIREVVETAAGGVFVPPGDDQALATAIVRLADFPADVKKMGASAREYVARNFNRADHTAVFVTLLEEVGLRGR
jgi:glycosyltransferase involved in cell wall biosynthesis